MWGPRTRGCRSSEQGADTAHHLASSSLRLFGPPRRWNRRRLGGCGTPGWTQVEGWDSGQGWLRPGLSSAQSGKAAVNKGWLRPYLVPVPWMPWEMGQTARALAELALWKGAPQYLCAELPGRPQGASKSRLPCRKPCVRGGSGTERLSPNMLQCLKLYHYYLIPLV